MDDSTIPEASVMQSTAADAPTAETFEDPPKLPFITTSDVLNQLNKNLKELAAAEGEIPGSLEPRFELQKRLPDGSTIPASPADIAASDLDTKIQQSAKFVAEYLDCDEDRAKWAESQRKVGNAYFGKADYRAAMDIYLTCLVVKQDNQAFLNQTLLPVLNNLAQCTLQLGMHKKTMEFCKIALEEVQKETVDPIALCKIHFKRAKARRLTGSYRLAREDLNAASSYLNKAKRSSRNQDGIENDSLLEPYQQAIQKEFRLLESSEKEARKNRERQKIAMQKALQKDSGLSKSSSQTGKAQMNEAPEDKAPRQFSTLKARRPAVDDSGTTASSTAESNELRLQDLSYWQYYCLVVARVAEALLLWLGDEETKEKVKQRSE